MLVTAQLAGNVSATHSRTVPAVNQREVHPFLQQSAAKELQDRHGTVLQAWGPLAQGNPDLYAHPVLRRIAATHGRSVPQIALRRLLQRGIPLVAKSTDPGRLRRNIAVFDFELSPDELAAITQLDCHQPGLGFTHQDPRMLELLLKYA
ncbi:aldo/keto reductase [Kitasatospora sp. NPDC004614]|uniref:aldo/keto reductase n=1 Tax=unclassified Kitasatospora TaxID=2633591 RepID=UPI003673EE79